MTIAKHPGAHPVPRPAAASSSQQRGAGEPHHPLTDEDIFALVQGGTEREENALLTGLSGEALMQAMLDAEISAHDDLQRPVTSVFGDVVAVEADVDADVERQARRAAMDAAQQRAERLEQQRAHDEAVGKRWASVRRVTWVSATIIVVSVLAIALFLVIDSRVHLLSTPVATPDAAVSTPGGYQVDPSTLTRG